MWAETASEPFDSPDYVFENLYDGLRCIAYVENGQVELLGRHGQVYTGRFPELAALAGHVKARQAVLDGELVVYQGRVMDASAALTRAHSLTEPAARDKAKGTPATYVAFDILAVDDVDLTASGSAVPLRERRMRLEDLVGPSAGARDEREGRLRLANQVVGQGIASFEGAVENGFEGVLAKQADSLYYPGQRRAEWLKVKGIREGCFLVCGLSHGEGRRADSFGALLLGRLDDRGRLQYYGCVGSGFTERDLREIKGNAETLVTDQSPFRVPVQDTHVAMFLRPALVVDVKYHEFTAEGRLRHPVFQRLRPDLKPEDCRA